MQRGGFIVLDRGIFDHHLLVDPARFRAWCWLISRACWKAQPFDIGGKTVSLLRGQLCVSRAQLSEAWKWSPSAVERFLTRLETEQMVGREAGQGRTVITIRNYDKYQGLSDPAGQATERQSGQRSDSDRTAKEPRNQDNQLEPKGSCASDDALTPADVLEGWNTLAVECGLPIAKSMKDSRLRACKARLREYPEPEAWLRAFRHIRQTPFLRGDDGKDWRATIDFVLQASSFTKLTEESYGKAN